MAKSLLYHHAGLGGTFDHLHTGHQVLIKKALATAQTASIGITTGAYTRTQTKILANLIEPYQNRLGNLQKYLAKIKAGNRVKLFALSDAIGPTLTDPTIDSLVCTDHTYEGMLAINRLRQSRGLVRLPIIKARLVKDASGLYISSTRIRQGFIDTTGHVYLYLLPHTIKLSPSQRDQCIKPFGKLIALSEIAPLIKKTQPPFIGVVGDQSLANFIKSNLPYDLGIFDNLIQRHANSLIKKFISALPRSPIIIPVTNPPGLINAEAVQAISRAVQNPPGLIEIQGEEDLLVIPLILASPLKSLIFYGQPNRGMVILAVTPRLKNRIVKLIKA